MSTSKLRALHLIAFSVVSLLLTAQVTITGTVSDISNGETLIGATVIIKGTTKGVQTDFDGNFALDVTEFPVTLVISFVGYQPKEVPVSNATKALKIKLETNQVVLKQAEVIGSRISDKQKQAPLTVETMDVIAIKEAPSGDFYESLGTLKGVDMTAASMGFKVINTRGFNSTSPVRSLQLIDGVDNQSPGLNFSLGNFLGASDLDVMKVDIVAGASSAFYGPGAFNGVINMKTKSPWLFPGTSVFVKGGERQMLQAAVRHAEVHKDKDGADRWAFKLNAYIMRANDWQAENFSPTIDSPTDEMNPGRYDAVNIYGDEEVAFNNNFLGSTSERNDYPGLGRFLRNGYSETDLVEYDAENFKLGGSFHYLLKDSLEIVASSNFSTGSTVYQGDNRYRLEGVQFFQHKLEIGKWDDWNVRGYVTHEDAGQTYDVYTTALRLQDISGTTQEWNVRYFNLWRNWMEDIVESRPDYIEVSEAITLGWDAETWIAWQDQYIEDNLSDFQYYHELVKDSVNNLNLVNLRPFLSPGTTEFQEAFDDITSKKFTEGGSLFFDRSMLWHVMGDKKFETSVGELTVGGNFRQYRPNTDGTIFRDTGSVVIRNSEFGLFGGIKREMMNDRLASTFTVRVDKNENFDALFSPALSMVYTTDNGSVFRISGSSAIRNPTLADQYLYYNVGRAILLGNIDGQFEAGNDSLFTISSFNAYRSAPGGLVAGLDKLDYFNIDKIRPEQVRTIELGYRGNPWKRHYLDASYYHSWYTDFIGYLIGIKGRFNQSNGFPIGGLTVYRVASNAVSTVRTQGFSIGWNYFRSKVTYSANYSWNKLITGDDDPIVPAFNTPEHKFNIGITGHEYRIPFTSSSNLGFGMNYKFVQGFTFEGSPQFTGEIASYDMVDAQISIGVPKHDLVFKLGVSNLFGIYPLFDADVPAEDRLDRAINNDVYLVFGGPRVGRLAYLQVTYEFNKH